MNNETALNRQIMDALKKSGIEVQLWTPEQAKRAVGATAGGEYRLASVRFDDELRLQAEGLLPSDHVYDLGYPGKALLSTGIPNLPIQMRASRLEMKSTSEKHPYNLHELTGLVKELQRPLAIFAYGDADKAQNIIVGISKEENHFLVGMYLKPTVGGIQLEINSIRNVFPKKDEAWTHWIKQHKLLYVDKERILPLIAQQRTNHADVDYPQQDSVTKIINEFENPKFYRQIYTGQHAPHAFYSNASRALESIRQDKGTASQWLAMLTKAGGIKAGEDQWTGLSAWLFEQGDKTLTRADIETYLDGHRINLKETHFLDMYDTDGVLTDLQEEFDHLVAEGEEVTNSLYKGHWWQYAFDKMVENHGEDFQYGFEQSFGVLCITDGDSAARVLGMENIEEARLENTTGGLRHNKEIALYCPDIEAWGTDDTLHFGAVGGGRCIGWVRFGETEHTETLTPEQRRQEADKKPGVRQWLLVPGTEAGVSVWMPPVEDRKDPDVRIWQRDSDRFIVMGDRRMLHNEFPTLEAAVKAYNLHATSGQVTIRTLVIDEIQSARHQSLHKQEVAKEYDRLLKTSTDHMNAYYEKLREVKEARGWKGTLSDDIEERWRKEDITLGDLAFEMKKANYQATMFKRANEADLKEYNRILSIPPAPFQKNWYELCMKRMLRYAAENGFDRVAWTTGEQQAARYDIGNLLDKLIVEKKADGNYSVSGHRWENWGDDIDVFDPDVPEDKLADVIGKDLAEKVRRQGGGTFEGDSLRINAKGFMRFYDEMLPQFVNRYSKKWQTGVKDLDVSLNGVTHTFHSVNITPAMKDSVMQGQPMFMMNKDGHILGMALDNRIILTPEGFNPETMVHEYTHVWATAMRYGNPQGWQSIKDLLMDTPYWRQVSDNPFYADLKGNEDDIASEVLAQISGRENAAKLRSQAERMPEGVMARVRQALARFWSWVGKHMFDIDRFSSVTEVTDRVLYDLAKGTRLETARPLQCMDVHPDNPRMTDLVMTQRRDGTPVIRCKVDGVQQMGKPVRPEDTDDAQNPENLPRLAERYFARALQLERRVGITR